MLKRREGDVFSESKKKKKKRSEKKEKEKPAREFCNFANYFEQSRIKVVL